MAFSKVYTFGPTFRAESSNTKTHAAEFWMIEPEIAFCDIHQLMNIEEDFLKYLVNTVLDKCADELEHFGQVYRRRFAGQAARLGDLRCGTCDARGSDYDSACGEGSFPVRSRSMARTWPRSAKKYPTEESFKSPVFVYDWPKDIKAFYMYQNDDGKTVAAVDLLVPGAGELMGGSQRETRYDLLCQRMSQLPTFEGADVLVCESASLSAAARTPASAWALSVS